MSTVTIAASDFPAGVISFVTASLTLSEDTQTSGELIVRRTGGVMGVVPIRWVANVAPGILATSEGVITFADGSMTPDTNILLQLRGDSVSTHTHTYTWYSNYACTHIPIHGTVSVHTHTYTWYSEYTHIYTYTWYIECAHTHTYIYMVREYTHTYTWYSEYTHTHTYIHMVQ